MLAWTHQTPKGGSVTNGVRYGVGLPDIDEGCSHLAEMLEQMGVVIQTGTGIVPLTFGEIESWSRLTRFEVKPSEARSIRQMSSAYANTFNTEDAPCPIEDDDSIRESIDMVNIQALIAMAQ